MGWPPSNDLQTPEKPQRKTAKWCSIKWINFMISMPYMKPVTKDQIYDSTCMQKLSKAHGNEK